jgi:8-amino-7-oxononanoate synthase
MNEIEHRLQELEQLGLSRRLRMVSGPQGPRVVLDGKSVLLLCSNNYLGFADHPRVREAAAEAAMRWGVGAGASRLVCGTMTIHQRLERRLAAFARSEECVLFGSGYLANAGAIGALAGRGDTVFSDELNHASIVDGCRISRAQVIVYRHCDVEHLDWLMRRHNGRGRWTIVTDSVFSMDGDIAPLPEIVALARLHGARTIVDEAHAIGALGPEGRGVVAQAGLEGEIDIVVGTLGKALGSYGAYACARAQTIRYLINTARPLIFSTAPPPPAIAGALAALQLLEERPHRVRRLQTNARALRSALSAEGLEVEDSELHIVPLVVGDPQMTVRLCETVLHRGVFAQAIRPPTVASGTSRLRLTVMATHTAEELRAAGRVIAEVAHELGLEPVAAGSSRGERRARLETVGEPEPYAEGPFAEGPFDIEREGRIIHAERMDAVRLRAEESRTEGPFDIEREDRIVRAA